MKKLFLILMLAGIAFSQNTTSNIVTTPLIARVFLDSTDVKCVHFPFPPAKGYAWVATDTSDYTTGATATINPPDAVLWTGNCGLTVRLTKQTAEESDSLEIICKPLDYNGVTFANDSCWADWAPTYPPPFYAFSQKVLNWTDGLRYSVSLTSYLPVNCYGVMVILKQYAANQAGADAYCEVELTVQ